MSDMEILTKIKQIIGNVSGLDPKSIGDMDSLRDDLNLDSLSIMEVAVDVDFAFKLNLPDERYREIQTLSQMVATVQQRLGEQLSSRAEAV